MIAHEGQRAILWVTSPGHMPLFPKQQLLCSPTISYHSGKKPFYSGNMYYKNPSILSTFYLQNNNTDSTIRISRHSPRSTLTPSPEARPPKRNGDLSLPASRNTTSHPNPTTASNVSTWPSVGAQIVRTIPILPLTLTLAILHIVCSEIAMWSDSPLIVEFLAIATVLGISDRLDRL